MAPCDVLFDVEDLCRYICKLLVALFKSDSCCKMNSVKLDVCGVVCVVLFGIIFCSNRNLIVWLQFLSFEFDETMPISSS